MPKTNWTTDFQVALDKAEIRAILVEWFRMQRQGCIMIPEKADFDMDQEGVTFSWQEESNG